MKIKLSSAILVKLIIATVLIITTFNISNAKNKAKLVQLKIGSEAPNFKATDINGKTYNLSDLKGKIVVLEWFNLGCPFVKKHYHKSGNIPKLQKKYTSENVIWLSICSTNKNHKDYQDAEEMQETAKELKIANTGIIIDEKGKLGRLYGAQTTPHFFIVDKDGKIAYNGAIDSVRSANPADIEDATNYISEALNSLNSGKKIKTGKTNPYGCSVKYK